VVPRGHEDPLLTPLSEEVRVPPAPADVGVDGDRPPGPEQRLVQEELEERAAELVVVGPESLPEVRVGLIVVEVVDPRLDQGLRVLPERTGDPVVEAVDGLRVALRRAVGPGRLTEHRLP
jgi:hypothetical protein